MEHEEATRFFCAQQSQGKARKCWFSQKQHGDTSRGKTSTWLLTADDAVQKSSSKPQNSWLGIFRTGAKLNPVLWRLFFHKAHVTISWLRSLWTRKRTPRDSEKDISSYEILQTILVHLFNRKQRRCSVYEVYSQDMKFSGFICMQQHLCSAVKCKAVNLKVVHSHLCFSFSLKSRKELIIWR